MIKKEKLDFWIKNNYNVLLEGLHGIGKTSIVQEAFARHNLRYKIYNAATLNVFMHIIGIPEVSKANDKSFLTMVQPFDWATDNIDAVFFDELTRADESVRNSLMELILNKSINGKVFKNLRFVWAAINPKSAMNHNYDVYELDPAQKDRFQIHYQLPYEINKDYLYKKYDNSLVDQIYEWWHSLNETQKFLVSPRRVEYILKYKQDGGDDIKDIIPKDCNPTDLAKRFSSKTYIEKLQSIKTKEELKEFANNLKNLENIKKYLAKNKNLLLEVYEVIDDEYKNYLASDRQLLGLLGMKIFEDINIKPIKLNSITFVFDEVSWKNKYLLQIDKQQMFYSTATKGSKQNKESESIINLFVGEDIRKNPSDSISKIKTSIDSHSKTINMINIMSSLHSKDKDIQKNIIENFIFIFSSSNVKKWIKESVIAKDLFSALITYICCAEFPINSSLSSHIQSFLKKIDFNILDMNLVIEDK